jgi:hypothetical protein
MGYLSKIFNMLLYLVTSDETDLVKNTMDHILTIVMLKSVVMHRMLSKSNREQIKA